MKAWESKNAKNAAKAGGVSLMALSLAACGGSSETATTPVDLTTDNAKAILDAVTAVDAGALTVQEVADRAEDAGMKLEAQATIDAVNALIGTNYTTSDAVETVLKDVRDSDNADLVLETLTANGITYESLETALSSITASVATQSVVDYKASTEYTTAISSAETAAVNSFKAGADYATAISDAGTAAVNAFKAGADYAQALETAKLSNDDSIATQAVVDFKAGTEYATAISSAETAAVNAYKASSDFAETISNAETAAVTTFKASTEYATAISNAVDAAIDAVDTNATTVGEVATNAVDTAMTAAGTTADTVAGDISDLNSYEAVGTNAQFAALVDADARTLDVAGEAITLSGTATGNTVIVDGLTAAGESITATVDANGNTTVVFDFADGDDTVVLAAATDLSGVTAINIIGGTVDFTGLAANALAGVNITAASGAIVTGDQFLNCGDFGGSSMDLQVQIGADDDVDAILTKLQNADQSLVTTTVTAPDGLLTPAQSSTLDGLPGTTVTNPDGGAVSTTNAAPTIASAPTGATTGGSAVASGAVVADTENDASNWNGGSITISAEVGKYFGNDGTNAQGLSYAQGAGDYNFSVVGTTLFAAPIAAGDTIAIGTVVNNGETVLGTDEDVAYTGQTITFNANATNAIVNELLTDLTVEDIVVAGTGAVLDESIVTVTVSDGEDSASFTRLVDSDSTTAFGNVTDQGEIEVATGTSSLVIDSDISVTAGGIDMASAVLTVSGVSGDTIDLTVVDADGGTGGAAAMTYNKVSNGSGFDLLSVDAGNADTQTIIGSISGDGTNSVTINFNSSASATDIQNILQNATVTTTSSVGAHNVSISLSDDEYVSITDTVEITLVGDFANATVDGVTTGTGDAANNALAFSVISAATPDAPVVLTGNTYITVSGAEAATDVAALIASEALDVSAVSVVRIAATTGADDITGVAGLSSLGDTVTLDTVAGANSVTMTVEQAGALGTIDVAGTIDISNLESNLAADLSSITAATALTATVATADADDDVTFTGVLNGATVNVAGGGDFTSTAAKLDGQNVTVAGALVVSDPENLAGVDLSTHTTNPTVLFTGEVTIAADANTNLGSASLTVDDSSTLTIDADAVSGKTVGATAAATYQDSGSSVVVTGLKATSDLSGITAGGDGSQVGATAGSLVTTVSEDLTLTTANLGTFTVMVADGATLTGPASVLTAESVGGEGSIVVTALEAEAAADLSTLQSTGGLSASVTGTDATETATSAATTANVEAVAQVDTITLAGTYAADDVITITGVANADVVYTVHADDLTDNAADGTGADAQTRINIAAKLETAIDAAGGAAVEADDTAADGTLTLTADTAGTAFTATIAEATAGATTGALETTTVNVEAVAQVDTVTLSETFTAGDVITVTGVATDDVSYTVLADDLTDNAADGTGADAQTRINIAAKLETAIDAAAGAAVEADDTAGDGTLTLTADTAGTAFTATATATHSVASDDLTAYDLGSAEITVGAGSVVTVSAAQADGATITGASTTNEEAGSEVDQVGGSVVVTGVTSAAVDLSNVTAGADADGDGSDIAGTVTAIMAAGNNSVTLNAETNLNTASLDINADDLTLSASQANSRTIFDGAASAADSVLIDVTSATGSEDFSGIAASVDSVNLSTAGTDVDLSSMTLDDQVTSVLVVNDTATVEATTVTMTASQAGALGGTIVAFASDGVNAAVDGVVPAADTINTVVTAVADADAGVTYTASAGNDVLAGTQLVDVITGGAGDDEINGGAGADTLNGGDGDDTITAGDDGVAINGDGGDDVVTGGSGVDTITAGTGADTITSGDGDDTIVIQIDGIAGVGFTSADSGMGSAGRDVITDFSDAGIAGGDVIDLADLGGVFSFIGTNQFNGTPGTGEVRYTVIGGDAIVEVDVTSNGETDFQLTIENTDVLAASDFVL